MKFCFLENILSLLRDLSIVLEINAQFQHVILFVITIVFSKRTCLFWACYLS